MKMTDDTSRVRKCTEQEYSEFSAQIGRIQSGCMKIELQTNRDFVSQIVTNLFKSYTYE